ncbi:MAG: serine/threonine-protein phosphatase [Lachnospiraceae bacterium]|nr:serine/threonine-protein phosphatase [Lachnospiraceae bacterium]
MDFIVSATTDIGLTKNVNQDSYKVRVFDTCQGKIVFAILCDGMGGLSMGEVASAVLVNAFCEWVDNRLPFLCESVIQDSVIRSEWEKIAVDYNEKIKAYGQANGVSMGTTLTAILLTEKRYYIINVGDTRAYEITVDNIRVITRDQTLVAREVEQGKLTKEEAETDSRRSILLQCIGASKDVYPDMFFGETKTNAVYMLCSDGFRHEITEEEIHAKLNPNVMLDVQGMKVNLDELVELNKLRAETDNITTVAVRTF